MEKLAPEASTLGTTAIARLEPTFAGPRLIGRREAHRRSLPGRAVSVSVPGMSYSYGAGQPCSRPVCQGHAHGRQIFFRSDPLWRDYRCRDVGKPALQHVQLSGRGERQVNYPTAPERTAIIHHDLDRPPRCSVSDPEPRAEGQRLMGGCE
jgi:hypothetical protein